MNNNQMYIPKMFINQTQLQKKTPNSNTYVVRCYRWKKWCVWIASTGVDFLFCKCLHFDAVLCESRDWPPEYVHIYLHEVIEQTVRSMRFLSMFSHAPKWSKESLRHHDQLSMRKTHTHRTTTMLLDFCLIESKRRLRSFRALFIECLLDPWLDNGQYNF